MTNERFYTVEEVAERLRVTPYTLRVYIRNGELGAVKIGKQYRISEGQLQEFLKNQQTKQEH